MKAITVRQPWAWAIIYGGKDVENRTRNIAGSYRGPLVIHAGKTHDEDEYYDVQNLLPGGVEIPDSLAFGCVIGVVDLVDVHQGDCITIDTYCCEDCEQRVRTCSPWAELKSHHLVLENPRPLPIPSQYPGRLGLWELPDHLLRGVR